MILKQNILNFNSKGRTAGDILGPRDKSEPIFHLTETWINFSQGTGMLDYQMPINAFLSINSTNKYANK